MDEFPKLWYIEAEEASSEVAASRRTQRGDGLKRGSAGRYVGISHDRLSSIRTKLKEEFKNEEFYEMGHGTRKFYLIDGVVVVAAFPRNSSQVQQTTPGTRHYALSIHAETREKRDELAKKLGLI